MKKVIIGSKNPVKIAAVKEAFLAVFSNIEFDFISCRVESEVSDQPFGSKETKNGSYNRALSCRKTFPEADYFVGLEGGISIVGEEYWTIGWMTVIDREEKVGFGKTASVLLPRKIKVLLDEGLELGSAADSLFDDNNSKQKGGITGTLTHGIVPRKDYYRQALVFALVPFLNPELYPRI